MEKAEEKKKMMPSLLELRECAKFINEVIGTYTIPLIHTKYSTKDEYAKTIGEYLNDFIDRVNLPTDIKNTLYKIEISFDKFQTCTYAKIEQQGSDKKGVYESYITKIYEYLTSKGIDCNLNPQGNEITVLHNGTKYLIFERNGYVFWKNASYPDAKEHPFKGGSYFKNNILTGRAYHFAIEKRKEKEEKQHSIKEKEEKENNKIVFDWPKDVHVEYKSGDLFINKDEPDSLFMLTSDFDYEEQQMYYSMINLSNGNCVKDAVDSIKKVIGTTYIFYSTNSKMKIERND